MFFKSRSRRKIEAALRAYEDLSAAHKEFSIIASPEERPPSARLLDVALDAAARARARAFFRLRRPSL